jgi:hypothetical protein
VSSMLVLLPAAPKRSSFWAPGAAFTMRRADAEIGRIDLSGSPRRDGEAEIWLRDRGFKCRIHVTGRARLAHVPSQWVMSEGEIALHAALWESGRTFLIEGQDQLRLRRRAFGGAFAIERASQPEQVGEIRWLKGRLLPKPEPRRIEIETSIELPESLEVFLLWIAVQDEFRSSG